MQCTLKHVNDMSSGSPAGGTLRGLMPATGLAAAAPMLAPSPAAAQFTCVHTQTGTGQGGSAAGAAATACENATGVNATAVGTGSIANGITDQSLDSPKFGLAERPTHPPLHRRQLRLDVCGGLLPSPLWGAVDAIR